MLKKMVILGVIGFLAVTALGGTKLASYIRSEIREARERVESNIPPEKEISRLRNELKMLDKDIVAVIDQLARENVAVKQLQRDVEERASKQEQASALLKSRAESIKTAEGHVTFGDRTMTIDAAKVELETGVKTYTANQKTMETLKATVATRARVRDALEKQLATLKSQKAELAGAVDSMEAELNILKLQQMESKYQTDDTRLSKIKEDLRKLQTKVEVEREKLKLMPSALDNPAPAASTKSVDDIIAPLTAPAKPAAKPDAPKSGTTINPAD
jgi:DNA repair exonuclease SbcCD ATPase subunit